MTRDDYDRLVQLSTRAKEAFVAWAPSRGIRQPELYTLSEIDETELEFTRHVTIRGWTEVECETMPRDAFVDLARERLSGLSLPEASA